MYNATGLVFEYTATSTKWIIIKLFFCLTIFIEALVSAVIIECLYRHKLLSRALLRVLGSFSTGLVLAGGLVDVLPDAISAYARHSNNIKVPIVIVASTIALLLLVEKIISVIIETRKHRSGENLNLIDRNNDLSSGHIHVDASLHSEKWYICFVVLAGLSLHSLFEGVALGAANSLTLLMNLYIMIILHKGFVSASLVIVLLSAGNVGRVRLYGYLLFFSSMSAIGGIIGVAVGRVWSRIWLIDVVLNSIAAGTLVFIALKELVSQFLEQTESRLCLDICKIGMFVFGFVFLVTLNMCIHTN